MACIYRPLEAIQLLRPTLVLPRISPRSASRRQAGRAAFSTSTPAVQAAHSSTTSASASSSSSSSSSPPPPPRRNITLTGDTGQVRWSDLSPGEKAVRTTQQSFNLVVVVVGIIATGGVGYFLFSDVLSPSSKTAHFNRAVSQVRSDARCQSLLGPSNQISAHGEASWSRWARNRFISSTTETDRWGTDHLRFRFFVEGPMGQGVVHVHLVKRPSQTDYEYQELAVDVKGHQRISLVAEDKRDKVAPKIFGARWW